MKNQVLKEKRIRANTTQAEIAKKAGITDTGYLNYELGKREPKVNTAIKIAKALGINDFQEFCSLWKY